MKETLEIVNDNDEIIGEEPREKVHKEGLLHREIHIWFFTPNREIILQHRAKDKDTYPDMLDATVGGHVDPGYSYEETAIKEAKEETGLDLNIEDLKLIRKIKTKSHDEVTGMTNYSFRPQYAYLYKGKIEDLEIEEGKSYGFEAWSIDSLKNLSPEDKKKFIPKILSDEYMGLYWEGLKKLET